MPRVRPSRADGTFTGHRRHRTTAGYAHFADAHLVEAGEKIGAAIAKAMRLEVIGKPSILSSMSELSLMTRQLSEQVALAWHAFDRAAGCSWCVTPAAPILFFGDLDTYRASPLRILTVGLNPSRKEFPAAEPFQRFPLAESNREPSRYLDAMSAYFFTDPYRGWFNAFEPLLNGMRASYYGGGASRALHTDICSPVATDPTWSGLDTADRAALQADGVPLWHMLLGELRPQIVAISVAQAHLKRIEFVPRTNWKFIHAFERKADGALRSRPYEIRARWYDIGGERSLFVFGTAALKPFQLLADCQKRKTGELLLKEYQDGR